MLLSIVIPCHNEEAGLAAAHERLNRAIDAIPGLAGREIIYVNDGSTDATGTVLDGLARDHPETVRVLHLSRNFGQWAATAAGIDHATGEAVVTIDADLQDPPELMADMVRQWRQGAGVVYTRRRHRAGESRMKILTANGFNRLFNAFCEVRIPDGIGDYRLLSRPVVEALKRMPELNRYPRGMIAWIGFPTAILDYDRGPRTAGETKYRYRRMAELALDGLFAFSSKPLRLASLAGLFSMGLAMLGIAYAVGVRLFTSAWVSGWAFLSVVIFFFCGIQMLFLGLIGEYLGRIYTEVKRRPLYVVARVTGPTPPARD